jgi:hypothetical protein
LIPAFVNNLFEQGAVSFNDTALEAFHFQYASNKVYHSFCDALQRSANPSPDFSEIPFLPIDFFKSKRVTSTFFEPEVVFESSGTTQSIQSRHLVKSLDLYEQSFSRGFSSAYGNPQQYCILGLLPSYLERSNSSLVYMVEKLMEQSGHPQNGFYLREFEKLALVLKELEDKQKPALLIGVTFALVDFAEAFQFPLRSTILMETGGMKGRRQELTREEVHLQLKNSFGVPGIHSEYGMTELLSQAYSTGDGIFRCPPWMKIMVRDEDDPLCVRSKGKGAINIIDLANIYSCCFIATDDVGEVFEDGSFRILGRMDHSDIRGCSLLAL